MLFLVPILTYLQLNLSKKHKEVLKNAMDTRTLILARHRPDM